jgi:hypothetical protein
MQAAVCGRMAAASRRQVWRGDGDRVKGSKVNPRGAITCTTMPLSGNKDPGWQIGQVLEGRVHTRLAGGSYLIMVNGRDVVACSPYYWLRGQRVVMEVHGREGSQYLVRLLQTADNNESFTCLAARMGLEDTPLTRALLSGFMVEQLPLQPELVQRAALMLESMGNGSLEGVAVVLQALKSELLAAPPAVLEALRFFVVGEQETPGGNESRLLTFTRQLAALLAVLSPEQQQKAREILQLLVEMQASMVLKPAEGAGKVLKQLQNLLATQLPVAGQQEGMAAPKGITGEMAGDLAGAGREQQNKPPAFSNLLLGFSHLLQELRQVLVAAGPEGQRLITGGEILESQMAGHQLFQSLEQQEWLYFNLPFINSEQKGTWGYLRIKKDNSSTKVINPQNFSMTLMLNTVNLGQLLLEIKVCDRVVQASGRVGETRVADLLRQAWPGLQQAFAGLGYQLQQCRWRVGNVSKLQPVTIEHYGTAVQHSHLDSLV